MLLPSAPFGSCLVRPGGWPSKSTSSRTEVVAERRSRIELLYRIHDWQCRNQKFFQWPGKVIFKITSFHFIKAGYSYFPSPGCHALKYTFIWFSNPSLIVIYSEAAEESPKMGASARSSYNIGGVRKVQIRGALHLHSATLHQPYLVVGECKYWRESRPFPLFAAKAEHLVLKEEEMLKRQILI